MHIWPQSYKCSEQTPLIPLPLKTRPIAPTVAQDPPQQIEFEVGKCNEIYRILTKRCHSFHIIYLSKVFILILVIMEITG